MKSSQVPLNSFLIIHCFSLIFIDIANIYWSNRISSKEEEVKSLEGDRDKFRKELEEEIEYLLNEKNQMQSRHMVSTTLFMVKLVETVPIALNRAISPFGPDTNWSVLYWL